VDSDSEIQKYNVYPMLHFCRKFSSGIIADFILSVNLLTVSRPKGFCLSSKPIQGIHSVSSRNRDCCKGTTLRTLRLPGRECVN